MGDSLASCVRGAILSVLCAASSLCADDSVLALEAHVYANELDERLPLIAKLTIRNTTEEVVHTRFSADNVLNIELNSALVLTDGQRVFRLTYRGGSQANVPMQPAIFPLPARSSIAFERVVSLIQRMVPPKGWAGKTSELYKSVDPGIYTAHFEVYAVFGEELISNDFELTILEAQGVNVAARDRITLRHAGFFEGRDRPFDESAYDGRKWHKKVDVSRFGELQKILDDYPDSTYAQWIRFWKLYHHGPVDDAIAYAQEHRDFPLADNLLLRMAERLFQDATKHDRAAYDRVRDLVAELLRDFPDGDTHAQVLALQEKLTKKPGAN